MLFAFKAVLRVPVMAVQPYIEMCGSFLELELPIIFSCSRPVISRSPPIIEMTELGQLMAAKLSKPNRLSQKFLATGEIEERGSQPISLEDRT